MESSTLVYNNSSSPRALNKTTNEQLRPQRILEPGSSSSSFSEIITRLVMGKPLSKSAIKGSDDNQNSTSTQVSSKPTENKSNSNELQNSQITDSSFHPVFMMPKRPCKAPSSKKFGHPCICGTNHANHQGLNSMNNNNNNNNGSLQGSLPQAAYTNPLQLYDQVSRKCLPTSRSRDMLLKECHVPNNNNVFQHYQNSKQQHHSCVYDDLICDPRKFRCVCKPSYHLYYANSNSTSFGCVPLISSQSSPDGRINCKPNYVYNVISRECQKVFDVNELQNGPRNVSATQLSFVTIVLIWILLLILIVTAKLRKLRTSNLYRNSPNSERRTSSSYRHHNNSNRTTWLHPFLAAVNSHHHLNPHRTTVDRFTQSMTVDESGNNYNDTDFFLTNGLNDRDRTLGDNHAGSLQSLNNPPPKFEEIYPSCPLTTTTTTNNNTVTAASDETDTIRPPSNEDLPSYDEAMKLQNTVPPDIKE